MSATMPETFTFDAAADDVRRALGKVGLRDATTHRIVPLRYDRTKLVVATDAERLEATRARVRSRSNVQTIVVEKMDPSAVSVAMRQLQAAYTVPKFNSTEEIIVKAIAETSVRGGSDIFVVPNAHNIRVWGVVNGEDRELATIERGAYETDILGSLIPGLIKQHNPRETQSAPYDVNYDGITASCRLRTYPRTLRTREGTFDTPALVFRIHPDQRDLPRPHELGVEAEAIAALRRSLETEKQQVLISGLPGSGKTTTLYAVLREIAIRKPRIFSLESPIEVIVDELIQREVRSVAEARSERQALLQMAPQIVFFGEALGKEDFLALVEFVETGVCGVTTMHEKTALAALHRALQMADHRYIQKVQFVWAQTLIVPVCKECSLEVAPSPACAWHLKQLGLEAPDRVRQRVAKPGCPSCDGQGTAGARRPLFEFIHMNSKLRERIFEQRWQPADLLPIAYPSLETTIAYRGAKALIQGEIDEAQYLALGDDHG